MIEKTESTCLKDIETLVRDKIIIAGSGNILKNSNSFMTGMRNGTKNNLLYFFSEEHALISLFFSIQEYYI